MRTVLGLGSAAATGDVTSIALTSCVGVSSGRLARCVFAFMPASCIYLPCFWGAFPSSRPSTGVIAQQDADGIRGSVLDNFTAGAIAVMG